MNLVRSSIAAVLVDFGGFGLLRTEFLVLYTAGCCCYPFHSDDHVELLLLLGVFIPASCGIVREKTCPIRDNIVVKGLPIY